jgi:hypothetical protein
MNLCLKVNKGSFIDKYYDEIRQKKSFLDFNQTDFNLSDLSIIIHENKSLFNH